MRVRAVTRRHWTLIAWLRRHDEYAALARDRIEADSPLFATRDRDRLRITY
jgi:hypothetical protein